MSVVKANTYQDASGGSNAVFSGVASPPSSMGFRNRIINGNMVIDQRNAGASVTLNSGTTYTLDRWFYFANGANKFTVQRNAGSVTPPASFTNYMGLTVASAVSIGSGDYYLTAQRIEGFNVADLGWGAAGAQTITISFWVRSSLTGTFGASVQNGASNRSYPFTYTISAANTWEQKTATIPGDTSGTWATDNSGSLTLWFGLGVGSSLSGTAGSWSGSDFRSATGGVSVVGTNGATFYITGVQLEAGSVASPFERRDYGRELMMCQRYCQVFRSTGGEYDYYASGAFYNSTQGRFFKPLLVTMRSSPTFSRSGTFYVDAVSYVSLSALALEAAEPEAVRLSFTASSAGSNATGYGGFLASSTSNTESMVLAAEL